MIKNTCKCGCGKEIIIQHHHKYYGTPKYILGHNSRENSKYYFEKGHKPWNKGLKMPEISGDKNPAKRLEVRKKISKKLIGKVSHNKGKTKEN